MTTKTEKVEKVSKSQLIRDQLKSMKPSERNPKAIVEALKKKGCVVSPTFVSVVKSKMKPKRRAAGKSKSRRSAAANRAWATTRNWKGWSGRSAAANRAWATTRNWKGWSGFLKNGKDFGNLMLAKNFLAAAGDIDQAKRVLDVVNKLVS